MLPGFCNDVITIKRASSSGARSERDWAHATSTEVHGCSVQPSTTTGEHSGRQATSITMDAYVPIGTDIRPSDRVEFNLDTYAVDGMPIKMVTPMHSRGCLRVSLKRWEG